MSPKTKPKDLIFNKISALQAEHELSRVELAKQAEVNPQTIGALERGDHYPSLDLAFRICVVFGPPVEAVFSREEFKPMPSALYRKES